MFQQMEGLRRDHVGNSCLEKKSTPTNIIPYTYRVAEVESKQKSLPGVHMSEFQNSLSGWNFLMVNKTSLCQLEHQHNTCLHFWPLSEDYGAMGKRPAYQSHSAAKVKCFYYLFFYFFIHNRKTFKDLKIIHYCSSQCFLLGKHH